MPLSIVIKVNLAIILYSPWFSLILVCFSSLPISVLMLGVLCSITY